MTISGPRNLVDQTALCRACGLCCDGSLFGRVRLEANEVAGARKRGLRVVDNEGSFEQPCSALGPDRACAIYTERPAACRAFVCALYMRSTPLAERLVAIARARELLDRATLSEAELAELRERMDGDFARVVP